MSLAKLNLPLPDHPADRPPGSLAQHLFFETLYQGDHDYAHYQYNGQKPYTASILNGSLQVTVYAQQTFNVFVAGAQGRATILKAQNFPELTRPIKRAFRLQFITPTAFSRGSNKYHLLPDPDFVYKGLTVKWRKYSPLTLPDLDTRAIAVKRISLETIAYPLQTNGHQFTLHGFTGVAEYAYHGRDAEKTFSALSRFAEFAGIGMRTGMGMGQVLVA